jgi:hypothetical protein
LLRFAADATIFAAAALPPLRHFRCRDILCRPPLADYCDALLFAADIPFYAFDTLILADALRC